MGNGYRESRPWILWPTILAVIFVGVGIFFYYTFFRQSESELVEAIPVDAVFVFEVNNNDDFATNASSLSVYLNELFAMDALPAFETICSKLPSKNHLFTISAHPGQGDGIFLLFNLKADKSDFQRLLRTFRIDPKNYTSFENHKIYTYGTNFKSMKFAYNNGILSVSSDMELLKRALLQQRHPKKILSDKKFKEVYELTGKNRKQNWLLLNEEPYSKIVKTFLKDESGGRILREIPASGWSALQLRFSKNEIFMSGYATAGDEKMSEKPGDRFLLSEYLPNRTSMFVRYEIPEKKSMMIAAIPGLDKTGRQILSDELAPNEFVKFSFTRDTSHYTMLAMIPDTALPVLRNLTGLETRVYDSLVTYGRDNCFSLSDKYLRLFHSITGDSLRFVTELNGALVFAESPALLRNYRSYLLRNSSLAQNASYKFLSDVVASSAIKEIAIINDRPEMPLSRHLSEKGLSSMVGQNLRALSLSYGSQTDGKFVPINIYLLFQ